MLNVKICTYVTIMYFKNEQNGTFKKAAAVQDPPPGTLLILFKSAVADSVKKRK